MRIAYYQAEIMETGGSLFWYTPHHYDKRYSMGG